MKTGRKENETDPRDAIVGLASVPRRIPPIDMAIAGGLLLWAVLEALFMEGSGSTPARVACALGITLPVLVRRRWPIQALAVIAAFVVLRSSLGDTPEEGSMPMPVMLVMGFSVALYGRPVWLALLCAPAPIAIMVAAQFAGDESGVDYLIGSCILLGSWAAGWAVRQRAQQVHEARDLAPQIAGEAVAAERTRIARELHDVVAHSVSIIAVQAGAAEAQIDSDPERAREHMRNVRNSAHESLVELRRLVGLLREDDASYAPAPGLARLQDLIDEARENGADVTLETNGGGQSLPGGLDLTAYRVIQESLTNARRHSGGAPTVVRVERGPSQLAIDVTNDAGEPDPSVGEGSGQGLIGMRERVRIYGGSLTAEPTSDGGFAVRAVLPIEVTR